MTVTVKRKNRRLISRTGGRKSGGIVRIDEEACRAIERLCEQAGGAVGVSKLTSALIKEAAKEAVIKVEDD